MTSSDIAAIILAAGKGTRMKSSLHKVLHPVAGRPMLDHVMAAVASLDPVRQVVVVGNGREQVETAVKGRADTVVQEPQLGTGHAVQQAEAALKDFIGDVLILYGDVPLTSAETLRRMIDARRRPGADGQCPALVVLGFRPADTLAYGRLKLASDGSLDAIVEHKDASEDERRITLCNSGIMAVDGRLLFDFLGKLTNNNANGEYYLTDIVAIARARGLSAAVIETDETEVVGVNARGELAMVEAIYQRAARARAMADGATLIAPETVFFSYDTKLGRDVVVEPNVVFGPGVTVGDDVTIHAFSHLEGATVAAGAEVGPYARLRPGADLRAGAKVGNFVEIKKSVLEEGAKVNHLTYIGDARVGSRANVGAGTITCNYDGFNKFKTEIGAGAFIGSNSSLVAPVKIGDGAIIGAGSVVTKDVNTDSLAVTRAEQREIGGWAAKFRARNKKK
ncbi:bifunctional UDP-N-acetylglucosamine diphosphorylase/glucosamine-1-phosphate N-acetyltransferase GlmU [Govanella unica]|uniref:Bifunctional protein GlmU n=1 Tax=Govanella unica TaxID=2975056 RepID=A0A9X3Z756_9PROT|nr:bifunctional UDP-N-acetylglucosamine diphosphorylase/glucosamine-1-phosphate N-acetyltransferase GlmU [Govania unica]MDA5193624.1 bifunctional UDP-N-acetylglucosamine diphosphorylase/glucosamine-1-phosphate N-acetyltransferase GlmU [Govania unica]